MFSYRWGSCTGWGDDYAPDDCSYFSHMYYRDPGCPVPGTCGYSVQNTSDPNATYSKIAPISDDLLLPHQGSGLGSGSGGDDGDGSGILCPVGMVGSGGSSSSSLDSECVACPVGSFSDVVGARSCVECIEGTYADHTGASACVLCPEGTFGSAVGASACSSCPPGHSSLVGSTTQMACIMQGPTPQAAGCALKVLTEMRDLDVDRSACVAACNAAGYCCVNNNGGCERLSCAAGCLLAWYADSQQACEAQCEVGNAAGCSFLHQPSGEVLNKCFGHDTCGCPTEGQEGFVAGAAWGISNDCSSTACAAGCALAATTPGISFYGRALSDQELAANTAAYSDKVAQLNATIDALLRWVQGNEETGGGGVTSPVQLSADFVDKVQFLRREARLVSKALRLVDVYEHSAHGPLFVATGYFNRAADSDDGMELARAMFSVQQAILDALYNTLHVKVEIEDCTRPLLQRRGWLTAQHFPGAVPLPTDPSVLHSVTIAAQVLPVWGVPVAFAKTDEVRPTGLYLRYSIMVFSIVRREGIEGKAKP